MGQGLAIQAASFVRATGKIAIVGVGDARFGRTVNSLAHPIDGKGVNSSSYVRLIELHIC